MRENVTMTSTYTHTYTSIDSRGEGGRLCQGGEGSPRHAACICFGGKRQRRPMEIGFGFGDFKVSIVIEN